MTTSNKMSVFHRVSEQMVTDFCSPNELHENMDFHIRRSEEIQASRFQDCVCVLPSNWICLFLKWEILHHPIRGPVSCIIWGMSGILQKTNMEPENVQGRKRASLTPPSILGEPNGNRLPVPGVAFSSGKRHVWHINHSRYLNAAQSLRFWMNESSHPKRPSQPSLCKRNMHPATWLAIRWGRSMLGDRRLGEQCDNFNFTT